jgi:hypothetical protein
MDFGRLLKWIVIIGIVLFAWKVGLPWLQGQKFASKSVSITSNVGDDSCAGQAERASEKWGSGLSRFVNPPYDLAAWSEFRRGVDEQISRAEAKCSCTAESCNKVKEAMGELRALVSDMDGTIRNGSSPDNVVQRQELIDTRINEARDLQQAGK